MPSRPAAEDRFTIEAPLPSRSRGRACLMQKNWPWMLTSKVAFHAAASRDSRGPVGPAMPALLTRTSRPPISSRTVSMSSRTWPSSETSLTAARSPLTRALSTASGSMSVTKTAAPSSRNLLAMARPMPLAPAVTRMRLAVKSMSSPCSEMACGPAPNARRGASGTGGGSSASVGGRNNRGLLRAALEQQGQQRADDAHAHDEPQAGELGAGGVLHEAHDVGAQEAAAEADGVDEGDAAGEGGAAEAGGRVGEEDRLQGEEIEGGEAEADHAQQRPADGAEGEAGDDAGHGAGDQHPGAAAVGGETGDQQGGPRGEDPRDGRQQADLQRAELAVRADDGGQEVGQGVDGDLVGEVDADDEEDLLVLQDIAEQVVAGGRGAGGLLGGDAGLEIGGFLGGEE